jgi:glycosyltransferase involved in cell wall biosynthesis
MALEQNRISAVVTTWNVEKKIRACIDSIAWADEVLVVDSFSQDRTVEICRERGCRILQHPYESYSAQNNWAIPQAQHPWVLIWDSDETCPPELRDEILQEMKKPRYRGYAIRRKTYFFGRWIKYSGWQNDWPIRLFERDRGRFILRKHHTNVVLDGPVGRFKHPLLHHTFENLDVWVERFHRYALWSAQDAHRRGDRATLVNLALHPMARFFRAYVLKCGFLDGKQGFMIAMFGMFSVFMRYLYLQEIIDGTRQAEHITDD